MGELRLSGYLYLCHLRVRAIVLKQRGKQCLTQLRQLLKEIKQFLRHKQPVKRAQALTIQNALRGEKFTHFSNPVSLYFQRLVFERSSCSQSFFNELQELK